METGSALLKAGVALYLSGFSVPFKAEFTPDQKPGTLLLSILVLPAVASYQVQNTEIQKHLRVDTVLFGYDGISCLFYLIFNNHHTLLFFIRRIVYLIIRMSDIGQSRIQTNPYKLHDSSGRLPPDQYRLDGDPLFQYLFSLLLLLHLIEKPVAGEMGQLFTRLVYGGKRGIVVAAELTVVVSHDGDVPGHAHPALFQASDGTQSHQVNGTEQGVVALEVFYFSGDELTGGFEGGVEVEAI
jgi:hypothetical protein